MDIIYKKKVQIQRYGRDLTRLMREKILTAGNNASQEHVWAVGLSNQNLTLYVDSISNVVNKLTVNPRRIFHGAIMFNAHGIVVCQHRLSEDLRPSPIDISIMGRLSRGGAVLGVNILDFVIFNDTRFFSFREYGLNKVLFVYKDSKDQSASEKNDLSMRHAGSQSPSERRPD